MNLFRLMQVIPDDEEITIIEANYGSGEFNIIFSDEAQELELDPADLAGLTVKLIRVDVGKLTIYVAR